MHFRLLIFGLLFSISSIAQEKALPEKEIKELFQKYYSSFQTGDIEVLKEILTKNAYIDFGADAGLKEMIEHEKKAQAIGDFSLEIKPGRKSHKMFFVKVKTQNGSKIDSSFIVIEENKKFKIKGTISDSE
jgi:hypothetical protein